MAVLELLPDLPITIRDYVDTLFKGHAAEHVALKEGIELARKQVDEKMVELNRLRQEVIIDRGQYLLRSVYDEKHEALVIRADTIAHEVEVKQEQLATAMNNRIKVLEDFRASMLPLLALSAVIGSVVGSIATYIIEKNIHP